MKLLLLCFLSYFCLQVFSRGLPGAYERVLWYYAYLIDAQAHDGAASKIAKDCSRVWRVRNGGLCSFDQFVHFIEDRCTTQARMAEMQAITQDALPDVDRTAARLLQLGKTGDYEFRLVHPEASGGKLANLVNKVYGVLTGGTVAYDPNTKKLPDRPNEGALRSATIQQAAGVRKAAQRVHDGRNVDHIGYLMTDIKERFPDAKFPRGRQMRWSPVGDLETVYSMSDVKNMNKGLDIDAVIDAAHADETGAAHDDNVKSFKGLRYGLDVCKRV